MLHHALQQVNDASSNQKRRKLDLVIAIYLLEECKLQMLWIFKPFLKRGPHYGLIDLRKNAIPF